jgi:hypothetical protein
VCGKFGPRGAPLRVFRIRTRDGRPDGYLAHVRPAKAYRPDVVNSRPPAPRDGTSETPLHASV